MFDYNSYLEAMRELNETTRNVRFLQACIGGEIEKVNLLLDNKDLNVDMYFKDKQGNDGFRWACIYHHNEVARELVIKYDYDISKRNLNYIVRRSASFNGELDDVLKIIESKRLQESLNKSLKTSTTNSKRKKI